MESIPTFESNIQNITKILTEYTSGSSKGGSLRGAFHSFQQTTQKELKEHSNLFLQMVESLQLIQQKLDSLPQNQIGSQELILGGNKIEDD